MAMESSLESWEQHCCGAPGACAELAAAVLGPCVAHGDQDLSLLRSHVAFGDIPVASGH